MTIEDSLSRFRLLPEIEAVELADKSVLVVGEGNVGSQATIQMGLAGIGRMVLIDRDYVGPENLCSPVFDRSDLGKPKVTAVRDRLHVLAPWVHVNAIHADLRVGVPEHVFAGCDAVMISTDTWDSRAYAVRWAHRIPGRVKLVVTGGLYRLNWDVVVMEVGRGQGCIVCPHGDDLFLADEQGGCGLTNPAVVQRPDPAAAFTGAIIGSTMVSEVVSGLAGPGARYGGKMLSFDHSTGDHSVLRLIPAESCTSHRPLTDGVDAFILPLDDYTLEDLASVVAGRAGVADDDVVIASEREMVRGYRCLACAHHGDCWVPLIKSRDWGGHTCPHCGAEDMIPITETILPKDRRRLPDIGYPVGKALVAYVGGRRFDVVQMEQE